MFSCLVLLVLLDGMVGVGGVPVGGGGGGGGLIFVLSFVIGLLLPLPPQLSLVRSRPIYTAEMKRFRLAAKVCLNYNVSFNLLYLAGKRPDR